MTLVTTTGNNMSIAMKCASMCVSESCEYGRPASIIYDLDVHYMFFVYKFKLTASPICVPSSWSGFWQTLLSHGPIHSNPLWQVIMLLHWNTFQLNLGSSMHAKHFKVPRTTTVWINGQSTLLGSNENSDAVTKAPLQLHNCIQIFENYAE